MEHSTGQTRRTVTTALLERRLESEQWQEIWRSLRSLKSGLADCWRGRLPYSEAFRTTGELVMETRNIISSPLVHETREQPQAWFVSIPVKRPRDQ